jgi:hypothetical protein
MMSPHCSNAPSVPRSSSPLALSPPSLSLVDWACVCPWSRCASERVDPCFGRERALCHGVCCPPCLCLCPCSDYGYGYGYDCGVCFAPGSDVSHVYQRGRGSRCSLSPSVCACSYFDFDSDSDSDCASSCRAAFIFLRRAFFLIILNFLY